VAHRIFLLSPASCSGQRARQLLRPAAEFPLARRVRSPEGAALGEVFSFLSGLYFRGKEAYARAFARPPAGWPGVFVITASEGLRPADEPVTQARLRRFARVDIGAGERRYRHPLLRDARALAKGMGSCDFVLLGSIATGKYVDVLGEVLEERLLFPLEFVGRGDMSRGGLLLRCAREGTELDYVQAAGAIRHGARPPKLPKLRRLP
jgi:hypothetical protein